MDSYDLEKLTPEDREQVQRFSEFLQAVGPAPGPEGTGLDRNRFATWIEAEPEEHRAYMGLDRDARVR